MTHPIQIGTVHRFYAYCLDVIGDDDQQLLFFRAFTMTASTKSNVVIVALVSAATTLALVVVTAQLTGNQGASKESRHCMSTQTDESNKTGESTNRAESVRLVLQRFRQASLLVENTRVISVGQACALEDPSSASESSGMLVYISFAKNATTEKALQAAKTVVTIPLLTLGAWGDGSATESILDMASGGKAPLVMLVPQANLISKVRGKSIQYHGQIDKSMGEALYDAFCNYVRALILEQQLTLRNQTVPKWVSSCLQTIKRAIDDSVSPDIMFQDEALYSAWDKQGIPTKDAAGEDLTRSAIKKLKKQYDSQAKRYEKYLSKSITSEQQQRQVAEDWSLLDPTFCNVVVGTFGARQGLSLSSDMGPFCHVVSL
jgi:hypothetical protein